MTTLTGISTCLATRVNLWDVLDIIYCDPNAKFAELLRFVIKDEWIHKLRAQLLHGLNTMQSVRKYDKSRNRRFHHIKLTPKSQDANMAPDYLGVWARTNNHGPLKKLCYIVIFI